MICIPEARAVAIAGLPHNPDGFLSTDDLGQIPGVPDVYAVGDIATFPIKQGGIAAQQAGHVARLIARRAGARVEAPPLRLELHGLLLTGATPLYLHANVTGGSGGTATASTAAPTGPGGKIAAPPPGPLPCHRSAKRLENFSPVTSAGRANSPAMPQ